MDSRKNLTCPFWATATCKYSEEECKFAHRNTGRMGKFPHNYVRNRVRQSPAISIAPQVQNDEDLISMSDTEEQTPETSDESSPHTSPSRKVEETPGIRSIPASRPEDALIKKPEQPNIFFHAVKWGKMTLLRELLEAAKSTDIVGNNSMPLLAYAAIQHPTSKEVISLLLAYQFDPCMIPKSLWNQDRDGVASERMHRPEWCTPVVLRQLSENLDQDLRYTFQRAAKLQSSMAEEVRVARMLGTRALLEAPYHMVGQDYAIEVVSNVIKAQSSCHSNKPLMLAFVGPVGHGKHLLMSLFAERTLSINDVVSNSLVPNFRGKLDNDMANSSDFSIVYIDLDCENWENVNTCLSVLKKDSHIVTRTVCVFGTTCGQETIFNFTRRNDPHGQNASQSAAWSSLTSNLDNELTEAFGVPLVVNFDHIIPFIPFSEQERMIVAQRLIGDLRRGLLQHGVSFTNPESRRNHRIKIDLMIKQMQVPKVCRHLTERYNPRLGVHSIAREVRRQIEVPLVNMCLRLIARGTLPLVTSDGRVSGIATVSAKMEDDAIVFALEER